MSAWTASAGAGEEEQQFARGADDERGAQTKLWPPIREWLPKYDVRKDLVYDAAAGLTVGVMAIPQSLSYALIAGLPPQYGLYSDLQVCYPIFGSSKYLVVGPVAVMSLMSRFAMEKVGIAEDSSEWVDMVCFLSVLVAMVQFAVRGLGLGSKISSLLPETAIAGFSSAAALIIASTQLPALLGVPKCKGEGGQSCGFARTLVYSAASIGDARVSSLVCAAGSFAILALVKRLRLAPRNGLAGLAVNLLPKLGALLVVALSVTIVYATYDEPGARTIGGIQVVGDIPQGLPVPRWVPALPKDLATFASLAWSSVPIALVGFAEATAIAKASTKLRGGDPKSVSEDDEVLGLAFCNAFTAWVGGYPVTGSFSRTAINAESGARSALSTGIAAVAVVVVLLFLTPYLAMLPKAAVSAIVLAAVLRLVDVSEFVRLYRDYRQDRERRGVWVFASVFSASLVLGVETGLVLGVVSHRLAAPRRAGGLGRFKETLPSY